MALRSKLAIFMFFLLLALPINANAAVNNSGAVTATATVVCPLSINITAAPVYIKHGNITINYTSQATTSCSTGEITGNFILSLNNSVIISRTIPASNINQTKSLRNISINTNVLENATYTANVSFVEVGKRFSGYAKFTVVSPANIVITDFYASPSSVTSGSRPTLFLTLTNNGHLTGNILFVNFSVHGPVGANFSIPSNSLSYRALSPDQSENLSVSNANIIDSIDGSYTINATVYYFTPNTTFPSLASLNGSSSVSATYRVVSSLIPHPTSPTAVPIKSTPQFDVVAAPLLSTVLPGSTSIFDLTLQDSANATETLTISYPSAFSGLISTSANNLRISPGQSASIEISMHPQINETPGQYTVPINITAAIDNIPTTQTEFVTIDVVSKVNAPSVSQRLTLTNSTEVASGIVEVAAPPGSSLNNVTVETLIPTSLVNNVSQITAYGLPNNISAVSGYYAIRWNIASIPAGQISYAYYTINRPRSQETLQFVQNILSVPSIVSPQNILKVLDINIPTFYQNSISNITVKTLYTGTKLQEITAILTAPPNIGVLPYKSVVNASPNRAETQSFAVAVGNSTGTALLSLYVSTQGFNATYSLPIIILAKPITAVPTTTTSVLKQTYAGRYLQLAIVILLVFVISILLIVRLLLGKPKYARERASKLLDIREQIKRSNRKE